jgi:hypothetical protein
MKTRPHLFVLAGWLWLSVNACAQSTNFFIFLCFGQSNMEGFPGIEEQDKGPVHGEFVIEVRGGGDPAPLLRSPMLGKLLVHEKCDSSDGASAGQTGCSPGNWRDPSRFR